MIEVNTFCNGMRVIILHYPFHEYYETVLITDNYSDNYYKKGSDPDSSLRITTKLCGVNEAQRSERPNERIVM